MCEELWICAGSTHSLVLLCNLIESHPLGGGWNGVRNTSGVFDSQGVPKMRERVTPGSKQRPCCLVPVPKVPRRRRTTLPCIYRGRPSSGSPSRPAERDKENNPPRIDLADHKRNSRLKPLSESTIFDEGKEIGRNKEREDRVDVENGSRGGGTWTLA